MAGVVGFEPTNGGIKSRCLTAWPHPNRGVFYSIRAFNGECSMLFVNNPAFIRFLIFLASDKLSNSKKTVEPVPVNLGHPNRSSFSNNHLISS